MHWNSHAFKYLLLLLAAPIWWPFLKALFREFDEALKDEGGLFGRKKIENVAPEGFNSRNTSKIRAPQPRAARPITPRRSGRL